MLAQLLLGKIELLVSHFRISHYLHVFKCQGTASRPFRAFAPAHFANIQRLAAGVFCVIWKEICIGFFESQSQFSLFVIN